MRPRSASAVDDAHERRDHAKVWTSGQTAQFAELAVGSHHVAVLPAAPNTGKSRPGSNEHLHNYLAHAQRRRSSRFAKAVTIGAAHHVSDVHDRVHDHHAEHGHGGDFFDVLEDYHKSEAGAAEALEAHDGFYSHKALLQRESLRFEPRIRKLLNKIWRLADADDSGYCDREEYFAIHESLFRMMNGEPDMAKLEVYEMEQHGELLLSQAEAARKKAYLAHLANKEFDEDCGDADAIDRDAFQQAWFHMCNMWAAKIDVEESCRSSRRWSTR